MSKLFNKLAALFVAALCVTNLNAQQLNESFDGEGFPPEDWSVINIDSYSGWRQTALSGNSCAVVNGTYGSSINGSYLITPQLKPANGEKLSFKARVSDYASKGELRVEVSITGNEKADFTTVLATYVTKKDQDNSIWKTDWREFTVDLSAYKNQRIYIAFHQYNDAEKIYLDDVTGVSLAGNASCEIPQNLKVSNLTDRGATLTWEGSSEKYQYLFGAADETLSWDDAVIIDENSVVFDNLPEQTEFVFSVRAYCSDDEQSLAPSVRFTTACQAMPLPFLETFTRDVTGDVAPECWFVASVNPQVWVVADKTYDDEGTATVVTGQAHLYASGGGPNTAQIFALPMLDAQLDTCEVAFDYKTSLTSDGCGILEVGYMTNPNKASTFVSLENYPRTLTYQHVVLSLEDLPTNARYIAFRFAGGTSDLAGLSMDNFIVTGIGHSQEIDPGDEELPDAAIYELNYCGASFTWYEYTGGPYAIGLFSTDLEKLISGVVVTSDECDRFAYEDGVGFSEDDDYENKYYCSTKWLLNVDEGGYQKGEAWDACVYNIGTASGPQNGLKPGKYQVQIYLYDQEAGGFGAHVATIVFEIKAKLVLNLQAEVADDLQTATLTWEEPELAYGERIYASVRAGELVAFDNFDDARLVAASPLLLDVEEGHTYTAILQVIDRNKNPLGPEVSIDFTVGTNVFEITNPTATVDGENVTFTWETEEEADRYLIVLYLDGQYYGTLTATGTSHTSFIPEEGEWSWTIQAYNQGEYGNYFPVSGTIQGNNFTGETPEIPEEGIEVYPWEMIAAYYPTEPGDEDYREGKYIWFVSLYCGSNGSAYPTATYILYSDKEYGISGVYSKDLGNIYMGEGFTMMEVINGSANPKRLTATDTELRLVFERFDEEHFDEGYRYGRYSGRFSMTVEGGTVYYGSFQDIYCNSFNAGYLFDTEDLYHVGMWDEENSPQGIEDIDASSLQGERGRLMLHNGQILILRGENIYTVTGQKLR